VFLLGYNDDMSHAHEKVSTSISDMARDYKDSPEKAYRDVVEIIQGARLWMLRALGDAYQQDENKVVQRGARELAFVLADGKWPVSLSTTISTSEGAVSVGVRRISGKKQSAMERLKSNLVPVNMVVKDESGNDWMIGNLVGREQIDTHFGIFACQLDQSDNPVFVGGRVPYRGVSEVMGMSEVPVKGVFQYMSEQEKTLSQQEFVEGLKRNS
jgi:hypothetical protein